MATAENFYHLVNDASTIERMKTERITDLNEFDEIIEPYRMENDYFWELFSSSPRSKDKLINMIVNWWIEMFPPSNQGVGPFLSPNLIKILNDIRKTKNKSVKDTFII